jgi:hypothetical protein
LKEGAYGNGGIDLGFTGCQLADRTICQAMGIRIEWREARNGDVLGEKRAERALRIRIPNISLV